jgi:hypothetical protein
LLAGLFGSAFVPVVNAAAGVLDATETTFAETDALEGSGTSTAPLELYAVTMAAAAETDATITFDVEDSLGANITDVATVSASGAIEVISGGAHVASYSVAITGGSLVVDVAAKTTSTSGTGTLTITVGGGSETVNYKVFGPVTACTLANAGLSKLAVGVAGATDYVELSCTDSSGYDISGNAVALAAELDDDDVAWALKSGSVGAAGDITEAGDNQTFTIASTACDNGADEGEEFSVRANVTNGVAGVVSTGYIAVTCTDAVATEITNVTLSASSVAPGGTIYAYFYADDGNGFGLGHGGTVDFALTAAEPIFAGSRTLTPAAVLAIYTNSSFTFPAADLVVGTSGAINDVVRVALTAANTPGNYALTISVTDTDLVTAGNQAGEWTMQYTVTDPSAPAAAAVSSTIAKGPKGLKATATFGSSAAGVKVAFAVENTKTGVVRTYYRKATAAGVASYTLKRSGSYEVTAMWGDYITDTVTLKK